jgi:hypothetical protein
MGSIVAGNYTGTPSTRRGRNEQRSRRPFGQVDELYQGPPSSAGIVAHGGDPCAVGGALAAHIGHTWRAHAQRGVGVGHDCRFQIRTSIIVELLKPGLQGGPVGQPVSGTRR